MQSVMNVPNVITPRVYMQVIKQIIAMIVVQEWKVRKYE